MNIRKFYAFDFDDNILEVESYIYLKNKEGEVEKFSTSEFAQVREKVDNKNYSFYEDSFKEFRSDFDKEFIQRAKNGKPMKSLPKFVECINNADIFCIITARGNSPEVIQTIIKNIITEEKYGISIESLKNNFSKKYKISIEDLNDENVISLYINLCPAYPCQYEPYIEKYGIEDKNQEERKTFFMEKFIQYIKRFRRPEDKVYVGFSDDDKGNYEKMKEFFDKRKEGSDDIEFRTFYTGESVKRIKNV